MNMDRRSIMGMLLLAVLFIGWFYYMSSNKEKEAAIEKHRVDSMNAAAKVAHEKMANDSAHRADSTKLALAKADTTHHAPLNVDSLANVQRMQKYGPFTAGMNHDNSPIFIENENIKATIQPRGGRIASVELKNQKTYDNKPLILFNPDSSGMGLLVSTLNTSQNFSTDSLYFAPEGKSFAVAGNDSNSVKFRLYASADKSKYIEYAYGLKGNSYTPSFRINFVNMQDVIRDQVDLNWWMTTPSQEKTVKNQDAVATVHYMFDTHDHDNISEAKEEVVPLTAGSLKWVSFKQQFFSSYIIAGDRFPSGATISSHKSPDPRYVKRFTATLPVPFNRTANENFNMKFYFGPNKYDLLKSYAGLDLQKEIDLGLFGFLNRWAIIPIFNFLHGNIMSMGLVILLLTFIVKLVLFPIAYKSFLSSAKMRVLKPEIDEINERYKDGDAMQKQQATMGLYRKAGVNPMAGCFPLLLQIPILFALIKFFPAAFELRQQSFLWAHDLSTYDSIWEFGFNIPLYGDHMSLFALLMTISTVIYTWMNQQMMPTNNQFPAMKYMMYIMPVFFLGFLNSYAAALSYYYFLSNMITFGQMWLMRKFLIDEKKLHAQMQANKLKPAKKSGFMQRLEDAQKARMAQLKEQQDAARKGKKK